MGAYSIDLNRSKELRSIEIFRSLSRRNSFDLPIVFTGSAAITSQYPDLIKGLDQLD